MSAIFAFSVMGLYLFGHMTFQQFVTLMLWLIFIRAGDDD